MFIKQFKIIKTYSFEKKKIIIMYINLDSFLKKINNKLNTLRSIVLYVYKHIIKVFKMITKKNNNIYNIIYDKYYYFFNKKIFYKI